MRARSVATCSCSVPLNPVQTRAALFDWLIADFRAFEYIVCAASKTSSTTR